MDRIPSASRIEVNSFRMIVFVSPNDHGQSSDTAYGHRSNPYALKGDSSEAGRLGPSIMRQVRASYAILNV